MVDTVDVITNISSSKYIKLLKDGMNGRSLQDKTIEKAFDPNYKGNNKTVLAIKYLINLKTFIDEDIAILYIKGINKGRPFGWKCIAEIAFLCLNYSENPSTTLKACAAVNINFKHQKLPDGSFANDGGSAILEILKKETGKTLGDGIFASKTKGAKKAKNNTVASELRIQLTNMVRTNNPQTLDKIAFETYQWCELFSHTKTDDIEALQKAVEFGKKIA